MNNEVRKNNEAVSPVIGVILMVAITVVLAAIVFILVSNLGKGTEESPRVSLGTDDHGGNFTVLQAPSGLDWADFSSTTCTLPTGLVHAGDELTDCGGSLRLVYEPSNAVVYTYG